MNNITYLKIPTICPVCGGKTKIIETDNSKILICTNPDCAAKKLAQFTHFVSRNCMNVIGMSEATIERFISLGFLHEYADIYRLKQHRGQLVLLDGFLKSCLLLNIPHPHSHPDACQKAQHM